MATTELEYLSVDQRWANPSRKAEAGRSRAKSVGGMNQAHYSAPKTASLREFLSINTRWTIGRSRAAPGLPPLVGRLRYPQLIVTSAEASA